MSNPLMGMMGGMPGGNSPFGMIQKNDGDGAEHAESRSNVAEYGAEQPEHQKGYGYVPRKKPERCIYGDVPAKWHESKRYY